jgi:hypothetical protein
MGQVFLQVGSPHFAKQISWASADIQRKANSSIDDLKKLIGSDNVEEVKGAGFESQYKKVIDAVKQAGNGTVKVFRVELEGTRAEYYAVTVDEKEGRIVGLKALAVES